MEVVSISAEKTEVVMQKPLLGFPHKKIKIDIKLLEPSIKS